MKKFGFTLAEVLITLAIIGIVAALTIPTLMTDYRYQLVSSRVSKFVSATEDAALAKAAMDGTIDVYTLPDIILYKSKGRKGTCPQQYELKDGTSLCLYILKLYPNEKTPDMYKNTEKYGNYVIALDFTHNVSGIDNFKPTLRFAMTDKGYMAPAPSDICAQQMYNNEKGTWKLNKDIAEKWYCKN